MQGETGIEATSFWLVGGCSTSQATLQPIVKPGARKKDNAVIVMLLARLSKQVEL